ncbi:MAG: hypothetical protein BM556_00420 [Bacteriovorax sp. MedPE-SWde]|nr:MAG: hypothetical protein BM556_00420 [Bacteriovorax sp. MedPE-SWde]
MSFIVSFKGQFKPYPLPDLSHYDRVHNVYKSKKTGPIKDDEAGRDSHFESGKSGASTGISTYKKSDKEFKKEKIPHQARDLMSTNVKVMSEQASYQDAMELLKKHGFRHIPVINNENSLVGIVSEKDLLTANNTQRVSQIMSDKVLTCLDTTRLQDIAKIMLHEKLGALPVVNEKFILVGIVTQTDILHFVTNIMSINDLF